MICLLLGLGLVGDGRVLEANESKKQKERQQDQSIVMMGRE